MVFLNTNIVSTKDELIARQDLTFFKMTLNQKPSKEFLQELCIEIASRTPDAQEGKNEDNDNAKRLNPYVGALVVKNLSENEFEIYGASRSALHNGEHGECGLLTNILGDFITDGCEMYVSLEPCTQESRHEWTEPCCKIIANRRIKKVTIGMLDPNPDVAGHGIRYLIDKGIDVELFDSKYQRLVRKQNEAFSKQFGDDGDPRTNRKIANIINEYISDASVQLFVNESPLFKNIKIDLTRDNDVKRHFYRKMIENKSIVGTKDALMPFDVIKDFALFFYKNPYNVIDGASIRYFIQNGIDTKQNDPIEETYEGPLAFAFQSYNEKYPEINEPNAKMGFVEIIGHKYGFPGKDLDLSLYHEAGIKFINDKFGKSGLKIVREAFINAIIHRDYINNHNFIKISLFENRIEIENPVSRDLGKIEDLKPKFDSKEFDSHIINPKLMRYFQMINVCERNNSGFATFRDYKNISLELNEHYILKTVLRFK